MPIMWNDPLEPRAPRVDGILDREPFDAWWARVGPDLPHIPQCVADQWLHRHWGYSPYGVLPIDELRFERQSWSNEQILRIDEGVEPRWSPHLSDELGVPGSIPAELWLGRYMLEHGTWPVPIIVLDNPGRVLKDPSFFGRPFARYALLEGHKRSAFFHHLVKVGRALPHHDLWLTTWPSALAADYRSGLRDPLT